jgi:hypothetical protein
MLKHLTVDEMVALLSPWANKTKRHVTFLSIPEIVGLLPKVTAAYNAVVAVQRVDRSTSPEVAKIEAQLIKVDNLHDPLARCTVRTLEAERERCYAMETPDVERAARCDEVTAMLFPTGLSIIKASFLAESGNTARVAKLLEEKPEVESFLKGVFTTDKKPLLETVRRWVATGVKLEKLEHEREELLAKQAVPVAKLTIQAARSQWLKVVSAILSNLELSEAPQEAIEAIRGPVLRASERAGKRYAGGKADEPVLDPQDQEGSESADT